MMTFCREHNQLTDYQPYLERWQEEEMANTGYTLCRMVDRMMTTYMQGLEAQFVQEGGIKERMYAARTGYRQQQEEHYRQLEEHLHRLEAENAALRQEIQRLQALTEKQKNQENQTI